MEYDIDFANEVFCSDDACINCGNARAAEGDYCEECLKKIEEEEND